MRIIVLPAAVVLAACQPAATTAVAPAATTTGTTAESGGVSVLTPHPGARATSPLVVTGVAPANWYFEAVFPARLEDASGKVLAEAPAQAQSDWTQPGPKTFRAELSFSVTQDTPAFLVLERNQSGEDNTPPQSLRIPVTLAAR